MNLPRPSTKVAILPSAGYAYSKATRHAYAETKPIFEAGSVAGFEHIFVCTETNRRRRWGLEGIGDRRLHTPDAEQDEVDAVPSDLMTEIARPMQRREGPGHDVIDPVTGGDM